MHVERNTVRVVNASEIVAEIVSGYGLPTNTHTHGTAHTHTHPTKGSLCAAGVSTKAHGSRLGQAAEASNVQCFSNILEASRGIQRTVLLPQTSEAGPMTAR